MFVQFMDMHSGGGLKESPFEYIYIEAESQDEAERIFYGKFGHNPNRVTCTCCGNDYSISGDDTLEEASGYDRGCRYDEVTRKYVDEPDDSGRSFKNKYLTLEEYLKDPSVMVIRAADILEHWRNCEVPQQGYVWMD